MMSDSPSANSSEKEVEGIPPLGYVNLQLGGASSCTGQDAEQQQCGPNEDKLQISDKCDIEGPDTGPQGDLLLKQKEVESDSSNNHASEPKTLAVTVINESMRMFPQK